MKYLISIILILSPLPLAAKTPPADVILEEANQYTVKIRRGSTVGLNEDDGTSVQATGFLVDRARGWILTNAHVASRSPATLTVSFKGEKYISARRVFVDRLLDVAVLEVEPSAMPANVLAAQLECKELAGFYRQGCNPRRRWPDIRRHHWDRQQRCPRQYRSHLRAKPPLTIAQEISPDFGDTHQAAVREPPAPPSDRHCIAGPLTRICPSRDTPTGRPISLTSASRASSAEARGHG